MELVPFVTGALLIVTFLSMNEPSKAGYCTYSYRRTAIHYRTSSVRYSCGFWNWKTCRRYSRSYYLGYATSYGRRCCTGWGGSYCTTPVCSSRCVNGYCSRPRVCSCSSGWTGSRCHVAICSGYRRCVNGGTCTAPNKCSCTSFWSGLTCSAPVCSQGCVHGNCIRPSTCQCSTGWTGSRCNYAICNPRCVNSGTCASPNKCSCTSSWTGSTCSTPVCSQGCAHGWCSAPSTCRCSTGWTGSRCHIPICSYYRRCLNGGTCTAPNKCSCTSSWSGLRCSTPVCSYGCGHGYCSAPSTCQCNTGWTGSRCHVPICTYSRQCMNGGTCTAPNKCSCTASWSGLTCSTPVCSQGCVHGLCGANLTCQCATGWTGSDCNEAICYPRCVNGGNCTSPNKCNCTSSWTGSTCATPTCQLGCVHGNCSAPSTCQCDAGWNGSNCSNAVCQPNCIHGLCTAPNSCACDDGWKGDSCAVPMCNPKCQHNGTCVDKGICDCGESYEGKYCETPTCSKGCEGGECTSPSVCTCYQGWEGPTCANPICNRTCENGGTCVGPDFCSCPFGFEGEQCSKPICQCQCQNGGNCTSPGVCTCNERYSGLLCEVELCADVKVPDNVQANCTTIKNKTKCEFYCPKESDFVSSTTHWNPSTCLGSKLWSHQSQLPSGGIPPCMETTPISLILGMQMNFTYSRDCGNLSDSEEESIKYACLSAVKDGAQKTGMIMDSAVHCSSFSEVIKRSVEGKTFQITVTMKGRIPLPKSVTKKEVCDKLCKQEMQQILSANNEGIIKDFRDELEEAENWSIDSSEGELLHFIKSSSKILSPIVGCGSNGQIILGMSCFNCSKGMYARHAKCDYCPKGTYQDKEAQTECIECPTGLSTAFMGSQNSSACMRPCSFGHYSETGMEPCTACPRGFYQPNKQQTSCIPCLNGTSTKKAGAQNASECIACNETCSNGRVCDTCRCVASHKVCDTVMDCFDGTDEANCHNCELKDCPLRTTLQNETACTTAFMVSVTVEKTEKLKTTKILKCQVHDVYYKHPSVKNETLRLGKFILSPQADACRCPDIKMERKYLVAGFYNGERLIISTNSFVVSYNEKARNETLSVYETYVHGGRCHKDLRCNNNF